MLGTRIAALRRQKCLSQRELAQALGVSASAVGMYEQGRREPDLALLGQIAALFSVSTDYLLTGAEDGRLERLLAQLEARLAGQLYLRDAEGHIRPFSREELAVLLASLV